MAVELQDSNMLANFKKYLDSVECLGQTIYVRKLGEETTKTAAQAAALTLSALNDITGQAKRVAAKQPATGEATNGE